MAQRLITSTDDPLYVNSMVTLANLFERQTIGTALGTTVSWSNKWSGKIYCDEGCAKSFCPGHTLLVHIGEIRKHPAWKYSVYHFESYSNGTNRAVMYFYEDLDKAQKQADILRKRGRED